MKKCAKCNLEYKDTKIYCSNCGNILESVTEQAPPSEKEMPKKSKIIISCLLIVSLIVNVILGICLYNEHEEAGWYRRRYSSLQSDYYEIFDSYDFYNVHARIVPDDGSGLYHRYGCDELDRSNGYWIYNMEAAENKATACQSCCSDD